MSIEYAEPSEASTFGEREHPNIDNYIAQMRELVTRTHWIGVNPALIPTEEELQAIIAKKCLGVTPGSWLGGCRDPEEEWTGWAEPLDIDPRGWVSLPFHYEPEFDPVWPPRSGVWEGELPSGRPKHDARRAIVIFYLSSLPSYFLHKPELWGNKETKPTLKQYMYVYFCDCH